MITTREPSKRVPSFGYLINFLSTPLGSAIALDSGRSCGPGGHAWGEHAEQGGTA